MRSNRLVKIFSLSVTIFVTLFVILSALQALHLNTKYSVKEFFPKDHPLLNNDAKTALTFQLAESPTFFVALTLKKGEKGTWLTPLRIAQLEKITQKLGQVQGIKQVKSIANLEMAVDVGNTLQIGPLLKSLPASKWAHYVRSQALLKSQLVSGDLRSVLLLVEPSDSSQEGLSKLESELRKKTWDEHWTTSVAGVPAVQARLADRLGKEIVQFLGLSLLLFCLMFLFFYRNLSPLVFAAVGLIVCNITSLGWLSVMGVPFTILLSTLPIIVSISFVSITVHTLHLWADRTKDLDASVGLNARLRLSWGTLWELAIPNLLGSMTTAIGFLTLATANIPAIRTYALVVSVIVLWTWFVAQVLLLGFQHFLNPIPRKWNHARAWWMLELNRWSISVISITVGVCVVLGATVHRMNFSGRLFDDLPKNEMVRRSTEKLDRSFGGTVGLDVALGSPVEDAWKDPKRLQRLALALHEIRHIPGVGSAISVTDFMGGKVPATSQAVAEVYFLFSMASENPLRQFVSNDFREIRVAIRLQDLTSSQIQIIRTQVLSVLSHVDFSLNLRESGLAVNSHMLNQEVAKELVYGFWQSLFIIGILLVVIFRSVRWALMACLPNLIPPAILIGTLTLFQTPVKPGIALIFSIALGLAFNNTVYLLSRLKRVQSQMKMMTLPLRRALLEEGNPCFSESFIMVTGFLIFLTSDFKLNQTFGAYMILSIFAGALADLVFLPAILRQFSTFLWDRQFAPPVRIKKEIPKVIKNLIGAFIIGAVAFGASKAQADEASAILEGARTQLDAKSDQAKVQLKIIESNGEVKVRDLMLMTMRTPKGFKALARILSPADIKGTALLAEIEGKEERQWLYLPSTKQVRRVASATKSTGVLGSELSPEDLNPTAIRGAKTKLLKKEGGAASIELIPAPNTSEYSKVVMIFSVPQNLPQHTDYYVGKDIRKTVDFLNYKAIDGKIQRAQTIKVKNLQKNRGTDIELTEIKVNPKFTDKNFSQNALKSDW